MLVRGSLLGGLGVAIAFVVLLALLWTTLLSVDRVAVAGLSDPDAATNVLVIGSDSRSSLSEEQQREFTTGQVEGERTDTIFLLSVRDGRAAILAFPRDLFVERCDGSRSRINSALALGGPSCLVATVEMLSGLPVHRWLAVDFLGFVDLVDAVGGVELCLERSIKDPFAGIDLPEGCQLLDGRNALGYVRVRKIDNDLKRIERQQQFLRALADRIATPSNVLNPAKALRIARAATAALTIDDGTGTLDFLRLGWSARALAAGRLATFTVPVTDANIGGAAVLLPTDAAAALFQRFLTGEVFADALPTPTDEDSPDG